MREWRSVIDEIRKEINAHGDISGWHGLGSQQPIASGRKRQP
jgi:hypothetical protein